MATEFACSVRREPDVAVLEVTGDVDLGSIQQLRDLALDVFATGQRNLLLDLSGVTFIDSTGLGGIIGLARHARDQEGSVKVTRPSPAAARVLELSGAQRQVDVVEAGTD